MLIFSDKGPFAQNCFMVKVPLLKIRPTFEIENLLTILFDFSQTKITYSELSYRELSIDTHIVNKLLISKCGLILGKWTLTIKK